MNRRHSDPEWLRALARLSVDDMRRISRFVDLFCSAERPAADMARAMLDCGPDPASTFEARHRLETVIGYLEGQRPH